MSDPTDPFATRGYEGAPDLALVSGLLDACEAVDRMGVSRTPEELRVGFEAPGLDPARDIRLWFGPDSTLLAYGLLEIESQAPDGPLQATLRFRVHPAARARSLDGAVISWAEGRLREAKPERPASASASAAPRLLSFARLDDKPRVFILEWNRFKPIRYFLQLSRSLEEPIAAPAFPAGFTFRPVNLNTEGEAWVALFNDTFADHWDHHDLTLESYLHQRQTDPTYQPAHDLVAVAPDGVSFAGFCWSRFERPASAGDAPVVAPKTALLHQIGTRRGYRKLGLARAMLLTALRALQAEGLQAVRLYVDADNPTGATQLYESAGFTRSFTLITYARELPG